MNIKKRPEPHNQKKSINQHKWKYKYKITKRKRYHKDSEPTHFVFYLDGIEICKEGAIWSFPVPISRSWNIVVEDNSYFSPVFMLFQPCSICRFLLKIHFPVSQIIKELCYFFFLLLPLPSSVLHWHHEGNLFSGYVQSDWFLLDLSGGIWKLTSENEFVYYNAQMEKSWVCVCVYTVTSGKK